MQVQHWQEQTARAPWPTVALGMASHYLVSPPLRSLTANWPSGWSFTTPSARTTPSASNLRYHSSCNINPSAKGTGLIHS